MLLGSGGNMLKGDTKPAEDRVSAAQPPEEALSADSRQRDRGAVLADPTGAPRPSRFVSGARAILLLSLACWAVLLGVGMLLFG